MAKDKALVLQIDEAIEHPSLAPLFNEVSGTRWGQHLLSLARQDDVVIRLNELKKETWSLKYKGKDKKPVITLSSEATHSDLLDVLIRYRQTQLQSTTINIEAFPLGYTLFSLGRENDRMIWRMLHDAEKRNAGDVSPLQVAADHFDGFINPESKNTELRLARLEHLKTLKAKFSDNHALKVELELAILPLAGVELGLGFIEVSGGILVTGLVLSGAIVLGAGAVAGYLVNEHRKDFRDNKGLDAAAQSIMAWAELPFSAGNYIESSEYYKSGQIHTLTDPEQFGERHFTRQWEKTVSKPKVSLLRPIGHAVRHLQRRLGLG